MTGRFIPAVVAAAIVGADQATKTWALHHASDPRHVVGPLWLALTFNSGAAFGLGRGVTPVVEAVVVALVVALLILGRRAARAASVPAAVGLGLLLGGAIGNLVDRIGRDHHGSVIDFIAALRIGSHDRWPIFNLADAAIVVGAVALAVAYSTRRPPDPDPDRRPLRRSSPDRSPT
ncbi:MAG: signal peptidase II [Actinomycetota bacterium]|nr:signal peptidase II [Actinomycetota bacterium]